MPHVVVRGYVPSFLVVVNVSVVYPGVTPYSLTTTTPAARIVALATRFLVGEAVVVVLGVCLAGPRYRPELSLILVGVE